MVQLYLARGLARMAADARWAQGVPWGHVGLRLRGTAQARLRRPFQVLVDRGGRPSALVNGPDH